METTRDYRGVPGGDGAGGRTPHSFSQLMDTGLDATIWKVYSSDDVGLAYTDSATSSSVVLVSAGGDREVFSRKEWRAARAQGLIVPAEPETATEQALIRCAEEGQLKPQSACEELSRIRAQREAGEVAA